MSNYEYNKKYAKEWDKTLVSVYELNSMKNSKNIVILTILQYQLLLNHVLQI